MKVEYLGGYEYLDVYFTRGKQYVLTYGSDEEVVINCNYNTGINIHPSVYNKYFKKVKEESNVDMNKKELRNQEIKKACDELAELLIKKNNDYGDSFSRQYAKYGLPSAMIRMEDKMLRLENLNNNDAQVDESITDTLLDLSGYALLAHVEATKEVK